MLGCFSPACIGTLWAVWTSYIVLDHITDSCAVQIAWGYMVVLISGGLKNKIHSFRLFQKGLCLLPPDPYNHTRHKENPQPSPITTSIPVRVDQVVAVLNCTCTSWDVLYLQATPFRWDILTYLGKNIKANQGQNFYSELHNTSRTSPFPL